ncbi:MAG: DUF2171 domain-containing protein, partial [Pseudolabrys sp.]
MEVLGSDGARVGTAEYLEGSDKIKLTKSDPKSGGQHHIIPLKWADTVDDKVGLKKSVRDAMAQWQQRLKLLQRNASKRAPHRLE